MKILQYITLTDLKNKNEIEKAKLICYYKYKEENLSEFYLKEVIDTFETFGFNKPNPSRLKEHLIKGKNKFFLESKNNSSLSFVPAILQELEQLLGNYWNDTEKIDSNNEIIDETKFCGKRNFTDRIIKQINFTYGANCYDACAVLMRRLFEILIILTYQNFKLDNEIRDEKGNYVLLEKLVKIISNDTRINLSRNKNKYDLFREVGNNSAHSITYTAGKKDIDDIKIDYRVMLEELFNKSGLIT